MPGKLPEPERVYKVALFGETGCGKSSIINLLADKAVAKVSTGTEACTARAQWFPVSIGEKSFCLWDTMGFSPDGNLLPRYEQAHTLLQNLQGVDLILLCARKDGNDSLLRKLYWLLDSFFFGSRAPIALVLTGFDEPGWWDRSVQDITQRCNIRAQDLPYACITTIQSEPPQSDSVYDRSRQRLQKLLLERSVLSTPLSLDPSSDAIVQILEEQCQLNVHDAENLVERWRTPKRPFRVILFGEAGAGKSSVLNLIAGKSVADVSSALESCTLSFFRYEVNTGLHRFLVWDTVGFNAMYKGKDATEMALKNAARLVRDLHGKGGVDLLVFCKKAGRLSPSELTCFRLFQEFLCEGQVPVAFIITHLESYNPMEKWWERNGEGFVKACDLSTSAEIRHACITAVRDDPENQELHDKLSLSRQSVQTMLEDSVSDGDAFERDEKVWVMSFLKRLVGMIKGSATRKEKIPIAKLMDRCELTREEADELVRMLNLRVS